jgi:hypothetical protein
MTLTIEAEATYVYFVRALHKLAYKPDQLFMLYVMLKVN